MRKIQFVNEHYYHIYNRGIEKRKIFLDSADYWRFIQSIYEFNDAGREVENGHLCRKIRNFKIGQSLALTNDPLVDVMCYCAMPNHFHFLLKQRVDGGISNFLHRLGTGYTKFFNKRYERTGSLFEGTFKAKLIETDSYFLHLSRYIHLNPVKLIVPDWKEHGIKEWGQVDNFLENYRWSSYSTYLGLKNQPLINKDLLGDIFKSGNEYRQFMHKWVVNSLGEIGEFLGIGQS